MAARLAQLEAQVKALQPEVDKVAGIAAEAAKFGETSVALGQRVKAVDPAALRERYSALEAAVTALEKQLPVLPTTGGPSPP